jgi:AcrR family transcriptional regulator
VSALTQPRRRPTQAERRARTRAQLLKAAGRVFARRGFQGATLDEIAEEAGLSKGALYYNFDSKDQLFLSLLEQRIRERLADTARVFGPDAASQARAAGTAFLLRLERDPRWTPLFFEFVAYAARRPKVRAAFARWMRDTRDQLAELIEERLDQLGLTSPMPPRELAIVISALANGMLIERLFDPNGADVDLLARAVAVLVDRPTTRPQAPTSKQPTRA